jgi:hypothetical protein
VIVQGARPATYAVPLATQLSIGRGPHNDVVVPDHRVSWNHALILNQGDRIRVRDLGSRNGTTVDGVRITEPMVWNVGSKLQICDVVLTLRQVDPPGRPRAQRRYAVEDVATGVRVPVHPPRVVIGGGEDADLRIAGTDRVTVTPHADGTVRVEGRTIGAGATFEVSGVQLRVVETEETWRPTRTDDRAFPYAIEAMFDPDRGPSARITDENTGETYRITAPNRVSLLYYLAEAHGQDRARQLDDPGWRSDEAVSVAVWGRSRTGHDLRLLKALIYNIRAELRTAGFDPWCLEKRRGYVRLRVRTAEPLRPSRD